MDSIVLRRFRKEVRSHKDIVPGGVVTLCDDDQREGNLLAAELLLRRVFGDRITVVRGLEGIVCGSREEAVAERLKEYSRGEPARALLLSSLLVEEIQSFLVGEGVEDVTVFVPDTAEVRFIERLGSEYPDVLFGL